MLVWKAMPSMTPMMSPILRELALISRKPSRLRSPAATRSARRTAATRGTVTERVTSQPQIAATMSPKTPLTAIKRPAVFPEAAMLAAASRT
jgi:hypothetical protein